MSARVFVTVNDSRWNSYKIDFQRIINVALNDLSLSNHRDREISIILTNNSEIRKLNKKYRGKDAATNVLSFETGDSELLGDIFLSFDTILRESPKDFTNHAMYLTVHGILHLLGHDHLTDSKADKMEALEAKIMARLKTDRNKKGYLLTFISGLVASFGFAPFHLWPLTAIGIGTAYWLIFKSNKKKFFPFTFGAGYAVASFWWVLNSIYVVPELAVQFAIWTIPGLIGIALLGGFVFGMPFWLTAWSGASGWHRPVIFAAAWTFVLWLREWLLTGFPWNPVANITIPHPAIDSITSSWQLLLSNSMSLWGALGLTFILIGLIASGAELITGKKEKLVPFFVFIPLIIIGFVYGNWNIRVTNKSAIENQHPAIIRIVQPAELQAFKMSRESAEESVKRLVELSRKDPTPDIIIWPETAYPYLVVGDEFPPAKELNSVVITGAMSMDMAEYYKPRGKMKNSMIVAGTLGKIQTVYSKSRLVPFGEYRPFGDIVPTPGQLARGQGAELIETSGVAFVPAICYEIIFSDSLVPRHESPQVIINLTNDTWFGKTPGTYQHLDMTRRQAIETGLPVIRANYSGISAFIGADGKVVSSLPVGISGTLDGHVAGAHLTPYRRIGRDWWIIIILGFTAIITSRWKIYKT
ncbi:MAG: apolipoprotein N-acyltransferase [Alphaproteobacteria bacterium]|nr:apolipoprotein N-acyltransferase [Alphaproteobacteria bacterium]